MHWHSIHWLMGMNGSPVDYHVNSCRYYPSTIPPKYNFNMPFDHVLFRSLFPRSDMDYRCSPSSALQAGRYLVQTQVRW